jgi:hypothetical protein
MLLGLMIRRMHAFVLVLALGGCSKDEKEKRWDTVASATTASAGAAAPKVETGALNASFPKDGALGYKRVFTADKEGFAEAKLQKDGADVATLAISQADDAAKGKFKSASDKVKGAPLVTVGKNQSAVLVADKFQVKVSSQTLDEGARRAILEEFDLDGLARK